MDLWISSVVLATGVILLLYLRDYISFGKVPPYPTTPLPLLGHVLTLKRDPRPQFKAWRQRCGEIFSLLMGRQLVIVLSGYDIIKETLLDREEDFAGRPSMLIDLVSGAPGKGLMFSLAELWKEQRTMSLSILHEIGVRQPNLANRIQQEVTNYLDRLGSLQNKMVDVQSITRASVAITICEFITGHRFDPKDKDFQSILEVSRTIMSDCPNTALSNFMPFLRFLPGDASGAAKTKKNFRKLMEYFAPFVKSVSTADQTEINRKDFTAAFIRESQRVRTGKAGMSSVTKDLNLTKILVDLFIAGTDTVTSTIMWCLLYIIHHPHVQDKVHTELDKLIGKKRVPTLQDKPNLVYLNAVILETQRLASITPHAITHTCAQPMKVRGYVIPKGSHVIPDLESVLHDKNIWGPDVDSFRPERFIADKGQLLIPQEFIPFSLGCRKCLGASLAEVELFLFLSSMFHRFRFLPPVGKSPPVIKSEFGLVISPEPFQLKIVERE